MDPIKNVVSSLMEKMSSGKKEFEGIQQIWEKISGDKGSRVSAIKEGCITITADSSMRLTKLNLYRNMFLKELQKEFPMIVKIHFKVG
jgi:hypothetical protein